MSSKGVVFSQASLGSGAVFLDETPNHSVRSTKLTHEEYVNLCIKKARPLSEDDANADLRVNISAAEKRLHNRSARVAAEANQIGTCVDAFAPNNPVRSSLRKRTPL